MRNPIPKLTLLLFSVLLGGLWITGSVLADEVRDHGFMTVTIHDEPRLDLARSARPPAEKISVPGDVLVLPAFEVDTTSATGVNTFFAVRNITDDPRDITVRYHSNAGPLVTEVASLGARETRSFSLATVTGLTPDSDGIVRGYVDIFEEDSVISAFPRRVIQGDYFRIDQDNNFASGDRLLNYTDFESYYDFCSHYEMRFFNGGGFDGGTAITVFTDTLQPGFEFSFAVYDEAGGSPVRTGTVNAALRSITFPASFLADTTQFGVIEMVFDGTLGHVSGIFSALGRFSVGLDASCIEPPTFE